MGRIRGSQRSYLRFFRYIPVLLPLRPLHTTLTYPAFYGAIFPNTTFLLFFVVPMPAWALIGGVFAYDGYSAIFRPGSGTDSAGHLGGILAGLMAALYARRRGFGGRFGRF